MPLKIITDFTDPAHTRSVVYVPDNTDRLSTRPMGTMFRDPETNRWRNRNQDRVPASFFVGLDLGQAADYTAVAVVQKTPAGLIVSHLDRVRGLPYPDLVRMTVTLMAKPPLAGNAILVADATGVGRPIIDMLRSSNLQPVAVTITGGAKVTGNRRAPKVPKSDLINGLLVSFQTGAIKISSKLQHAPTLERELAEMRRKVSINGHVQYGAWRDGEHDDLTLALAIAVWQAERPSMAAPAPEAPPEDAEEPDMTGLRLIRKGAPDA